MSEVSLQFHTLSMKEAWEATMASFLKESKVVNKLVEWST